MNNKFDELAHAVGQTMGALKGFGVGRVGLVLIFLQLV